MVEIRSREDFEDWIEDKPQSWERVINTRAAIRVLPLCLDPHSLSWDDELAISLFRALSLAWGSQTWSSTEVLNEALALASDAIVEKMGSIHPDGFRPDADVAFAAFTASAPEGRSRSGDGIDAAADAADEINISSQLWLSVTQDANWLDSQSNEKNAARLLVSKRLWLDGSPRSWLSFAKRSIRNLSKRDKSFTAWLDWFQSRIDGSRAGFIIPGDRYRREDKIILTRLVSANNEDFWDKGAIHVNATLQGWLDEARDRVAALPDGLLPEAPEQDSSAITYGINSGGKVDRLPAKNQQHLRDQPDQRQIYGDVREAFDELRAEGQRLGETLASALDRIMQSMPEAFEDAQAYLVWRDGNRVRRLYLAHRSVALTSDPDPARLESAIAEQLGGALDLFNLFVMGDDGLRVKDEATIPFQERASAETEAALAKPVVAAMLDNPAIFTDAALSDLQASIDDGDLPSNDPYFAQTQVQANATWRNITAAVFGAVRNVILSGPTAIGKHAIVGVSGAIWGTVYTDMIGATHHYWPMLEFMANNASAFSAYAATAFTNYRVDLLIDAALRYFKGK